MRLGILLLLALLIVYGSLYPLDFARPADEAGAWDALFGELGLGRSMGDALGNFALFLPWGAAAAWGERRRGRLALWVVTPLLALGVQIAQIYVPGRTPAIPDVWWNLIGAACGALASRLVSGHTATGAKGYLLPAALVAGWIVWELLPLVPSLDVQALREHLKPLVSPQLDGPDFLLHAAGLTMAAWLLQRMLPGGLDVHGVALLAAIVAAGRVLVIGPGLDLATLAGLLAGIALWWWMSRHAEAGRAVLVAAMLFFAYTAQALFPFTLRESAAGFNWVPFAGMLSGSMLENTRQLALAAWVFGGVAAVVRLRGGAPLAAGFMLALWAALIEAMQTLLDARSADITEPLLALAAGTAVHLAPSPRHAPKPAPPLSAVSPAPNTAWWTLAAVAVFGGAGAIAAVLRLPQLPYNLRELFIGDGSFPALVVFMLALLWAGAGPRLVAAWLARSRRPLLALPALAFAASLVALGLLSASVTQESIGDISGSSNLYWFVTNRDIWGTWLRQLFLALPWPGLVDLVERPARFAALYAPPLLLMALFAAAADGLPRRRLFLLVLAALPWLWLCKLVAFDWSSTDNLNELIATGSAFGLRGGVFLYLLLVLVCAQAVWLARRPATLAGIAAGVAVTFMAAPVGWWLLNLGLEQQVHKYGLVFPATEFLLGPDRAGGTPPAELALRWCALQAALVAVCAAGLRLGAAPAARLAGGPGSPPSQTSRRQTRSAAGGAAAATAPSQPSPGSMS